MKRLVYIRLRGDLENATCEWCEAASRRTGQGPLDQVIAQHANQHLVFVLPGTEVTLTTVSLPKQSPAKLRLAAPYALEERLTTDADKLHCGLGPMVQDNEYAVAVTDRHFMELIHPLLEKSGVDHAAIVADIQCLPQQGHNQWTLMLENDHAVVRSGPHTGFACEPELLDDYLQLMTLPEGLTWKVIHSVSAEDASLLSFTSQHKVSASVIEPVSHPLHGYAQSALAIPQISLLQGNYNIEPGYQRLLSPWKPAAALAACCLLVVGAVQAIEVKRQEQQLQHLNTEAETALKRAFPDIQQVTNLRQQAMQRLRGGQNTSQGADFLFLFSRSGEIVRRIDGLVLQEVQYRKNALSLALSGPGVVTLDTLKEKFADSSELNLDIESANASEKGMQIRAKITRKNNNPNASGNNR